MGGIVGFIVGIFYVLSAWNGDLDFWGVPIFVAVTLLGILLLPKTMGQFLIFIVVFSPIAIIAALINGHSQAALSALFIGLLAFGSEFLIGNIRGGY
jgi:hypothetical protein